MHVNISASETSTKEEDAFHRLVGSILEFLLPVALLCMVFDFAGRFLFTGKEYTSTERLTQGGT